MRPRLRIQQLAADQWAFMLNGAQVGQLHPTYGAALGGLVASAEYGAVVAAASASDGLLPEPWESVEGICFSEETGDGRNFSDCTWTSRDPNVSLLPLMLQTETDFGHFGAELAGFMETLAGLGKATTPTASGRFYDSDIGNQFRDMLQGERVFGVSVDPGPATEAEFTCTEEDDGWCLDGTLDFTAYEIIGLTGTPFPAFARAAIRLGAVAAEEGAEPDAVAAAAGHTVVVREAERALTAAAQLLDLPARPPAEWFGTPEPEIGDERLVDQGNGAMAMPLQIDDDGRVQGHLGYWGQCHVGYADVCVSPPASAAAYAHFHVGSVHTAEGDSLAAGTLFADTDHADRYASPTATADHYAHTGYGWASVRAVDGVYGPWVAGALRPGLTDWDLAVLRSTTLSGDWRRIGGQLELIAALSVNSPGFPIAREALAASSRRPAQLGKVQARIVGGEVVALIAASVVRSCPECAKRQQLGSAHIRVQDGQVLTELATMQRQMATLLRRTEHLLPAAQAHAASRLAARR